MKKVFTLFLFIFILSVCFAEEYTIGSISSYEIDWKTNRTIDFRFDDEKETYYLKIKSIMNTGWVYISDEQLKELQRIINKAIEWGKIVENNKVAVTKEIPNGQFTTQVGWNFGNDWFSSNNLAIRWSFQGLENGKWALLLDSSNATSRQNQFITYTTEELVFEKKDVLQFKEVISNENIKNAKTLHDKNKKKIDELFSDGTEANNKNKVPAKERFSSPISTTVTGKLFFVTISHEGLITKSESTRKITKSESQFTDNIKLLLAGTNEYEHSNGLRTLIPEGTRLLSANVRNGVASLNFSEEFAYNPFGVEGYLGALMQVVYTATEFSTVKSVQFLIDGEKKEYLGNEGVWIGNPLTRNNFQ